ncbi:MAG: hypothetical protein Q9160_003003 [Pyrenula sp. 1 TL-2023]
MADSRARSKLSQNFYDNLVAAERYPVGPPPALKHRKPRQSIPSEERFLNFKVSTHVSDKEHSPASPTSSLSYSQASIPDFRRSKEKEGNLRIRSTAEDQRECDYGHITGSDTSAPKLKNSENTSTCSSEHEAGARNEQQQSPWTSEEQLIEEILAETGSEDVLSANNKLEEPQYVPLVAINNEQLRLPVIRINDEQPIPSDQDEHESLWVPRLTDYPGIASILMIAYNGTILSYGYNLSPEPQLRNIRTEAATYAAAYSAYTKRPIDDMNSVSERSSSVAGSYPDPETPIMYESPDSSSITAITYVGDHILLAVSASLKPGPEPHSADESPTNSFEQKSSSSQQKEVPVSEDVEATSEVLSGLVRERLAGLIWPEDK